MPDQPGITRNSFALGIVLGVGSLGIEQLDLLSRESIEAAGAAFTHLQENSERDVTFWRGADSMMVSRSWTTVVSVLCTTSSLLGRFEHSRSFSIRWSSEQCNHALAETFPGGTSLWESVARVFLEVRQQHRFNPAS